MLDAKRLATLATYDAAHQRGAGTAIEEKMLVAGMVATLGAKKILDVGVSCGHMTAWLALAAEATKGKVDSVDNWSRAHGGEATGHMPALTRLVSTKLDKFVTFHKSDSVAFMRSKLALAYDFAWIDADHSYEGALADVNEAIRISRVVAVHDTSQQLYDGPRRACRDIGGGFWIDGLRGVWLWQR